jgi:hypothetical protein
VREPMKTALFAVAWLSASGMEAGTHSRRQEAEAARSFVKRAKAGKVKELDMDFLRKKAWTFVPTPAPTPPTPAPTKSPTISPTPAPPTPPTPIVPTPQATYTDLWANYVPEIPKRCKDDSGKPVACDNGKIIYTRRRRAHAIVPTKFPTRFPTWAPTRPLPPTPELQGIEAKLKSGWKECWKDGHVDLCDRRNQSSITATADIFIPEFDDDDSVRPIAEWAANAPASPAQVESDASSLGGIRVDGAKDEQFGGFYCPRPFIPGKFTTPDCACGL